MVQKNYYQILNVKETASLDDIRRAYYLLARMFHPDRFDKKSQQAEWQKANELLMELNEAYEVLSDPAKRKQYDDLSSTGQGSPEPPTASTRGATRPESPGKGPPGRAAEGHSTSPHPRSTVKAPSGAISKGTIDINRLPKDMLERVISGVMREKGTVLLWERSVWPYIAGMAISLFFPVISLFQTRDFLWSQEHALGLGIANFTSFIVLLACLSLIDAWRESRTRPRILLSPMYLIRSGFDRVTFRWLWNMDDLNIVHNYSRGSYTHTTIAIRYGDESELLKVSTKVLADKLLRQMRAWRQQLVEAMSSNDYESLISKDLFLGVKKEYLERESYWYRSRYVALAALILALFIAFTYALGMLNRYFDDQLAWQQALRTNTATAYRVYLARRADGRWTKEAQARIAVLYDAASRDYSQNLSRGYEQGAIEAVIDLLESAKSSRNYDVPVAFVGRDDLPNGLEGKIRREYNADNVIPIGDAFSQPKMMQREDRMFNETKRAFSNAIPGDLLDLKFVKNPEAAKVLVGYIVEAGSGVYYRESEKSVPIERRPLYPGITFKWVCVIRGKVGKPYQFLLKSNPAEKFQDTGRGVYEDMSDSAFQDFGRELIKRIGLQ